MFRTSIWRNKWLIFALITTAIHIGALYFPPTQWLLRLEPLTWQTWAVILPVAATVILLDEGMKAFRGREGAEYWPEGSLD